MTLLIAYVALCLALALGRSFHLIVALAVVTGLAQSTALSLTHSGSAQYLDDLAVVTLISSAVAAAVSSARPRDQRALAWFAAVILLGAVAFARSPDPGVGLAQLRQVILPAGLVYAGFVMRDTIRWRPILSTVAIATAVTVIWELLEAARGYPLINPVYYYIQVVGAEPSSLRYLPGYGPIAPSYIADLHNWAAPVFRPGGPFMNPPTAGLLLGLGAFAVVQQTSRSWARMVCLAAVGAALFESYARGGMLIFASVIAMSWLWRHTSRLAGLVVGALAAAFVATTFVQQGNTGAHSAGLFSGAATGVKSVIGAGFGTTGYQSVLEGASSGAGSESLLGLYFAWIGLPAILGSLWVLRRLMRELLSRSRSDASDVWLAIGFFATVATTESASAMAATPVLWLILGTVLAGKRCGRAPLLASATVANAMVTQDSEPAREPVQGRMEPSGALTVGTGPKSRMA